MKGQNEIVTISKDWRILLERQKERIREVLVNKPKPSQLVDVETDDIKRLGKRVIAKF